VCCSALQYVAVRCSVLQCVAVCCSVLQRNWVMTAPTYLDAKDDEEQYSQVVCTLLRHVLQCVAVCGSVLQCVAVYRSVLQCDAV